MNDLTQTLEDFSWENYKDISNALLKFDENTVESEMTRQAAIYSYYHGLMSLAKKQVGEMQADMTRFASELRKNTKSTTSSKMTAKDLEDQVLSHPDYFARMTEVNEMNFRFELLRGLVRSLEQKKDMLQQVSANRREEAKLYNR